MELDANLAHGNPALQKIVNDLVLAALDVELEQVNVMALYGRLSSLSRFPAG
jgi:hypothetical protein